MIKWLIAALEVQALMTLASLPFILAWQLPFTPLSVVGNLIHPPFLIIFLALSSMLFFATIVGLPTAWLCIALNTVHYAWAWLLSSSLCAWWPRLSWWHLFAGICAAYSYWLCTNNQQKKGLSTFALSLLFFAIPLLHPPTGVTTLQRDNTTLICTPQIDGSLVLYDYGYISRAANTDAVIDYHIMPHIVRHYGLPRNIILRSKKWGKRLAAAHAIFGSQQECAT